MYAKHVECAMLMFWIKYKMYVWCVLAHCKPFIYTTWKDLALLKMRVISHHILSSTAADHKAISHKYGLFKDCLTYTKHQEALIRIWLLIFSAALSRFSSFWSLDLKKMINHCIHNRQNISNRFRQKLETERKISFSNFLCISTILMGIIIFYL